eukprot:TRINITY_DN1581_c0_g1_i1.p1 TRINITY_DN1581_c0_g1~~TRINITY_DN1581_c0_g1_i1.p1  ORF type:complete len:526 (+),score=166.32 TRINITY_DN1581_c0_g1_i1:74-1651(+)
MPLRGDNEEEERRKRESNVSEVTKLLRKPVGSVSSSNDLNLNSQKTLPNQRSYNNLAGLGVDETLDNTRRYSHISLPESNSTTGSPIQGISISVDDSNYPNGNISENHNRRKNYYNQSNNNNNNNVSSSIQMRDRRQSAFPFINKAITNVPGSNWKANALSESVEIEEISYSPEKVSKKGYSQFSEVPIDAPEWCTVRWVNMEGMVAEDIKTVANLFQLHPLTLEDILQIPHRPKMELYSNYLFFVFQIPSIQQGILEREQVSLIVSGKNIVTIQEGKKGDCWGPVRKSLEAKSLLRNSDIEFFIYSLVDAIVDMLLETVTAFGDRLEQLEMDLYQNPRDFKKLGLVRGINRELMFIRGISHPTTAVVAKMLKPFTRGWAQLETQTEEEKKQELGYYFSSSTRTYIRDIDDNLVRIKDMIDTYKEICQSLDAIHQSANDHMMNQIIFILTIVSTIFLPLTFLAGVYGMNFKHFPELDWEYAYLYWWILAICMVLITLGGIRIVWKCLAPPPTDRVKLKVHHSWSD